jgi:hypothetical protein
MGGFALSNVDDPTDPQDAATKAYVDAQAPAWGDITGTLSAQTDLQNALDDKADLDDPTFTTQITTPIVTIPVSDIGTTKISFATEIFRLVDQDITYQSVIPNTDNVEISYLAGLLGSGNPTTIFSVVGDSIIVALGDPEVENDQANDVVAALDAYEVANPGTISALVTYSITGVGTDAQTAHGPLSPSGTGTYEEVGSKIYGTIGGSIFLDGLVETTAITGLTALSSYDNAVADAAAAASLSISAGSKEAGTGAGGDASLRAGDSVGGAGGAATIQAGEASAGTGAGGPILLQAGDSDGGDGGDIDLLAGDSATGTSSGALIRVLGAYSDTGGGDVVVQAGNGEYGGPATLRSGDGNTLEAGNITVQAGQSFQSEGGAIDIIGGPAISLSAGRGGTVAIRGGETASTERGGDLILEGGGSAGVQGLVITNSALGTAYQYAEPVAAGTVTIGNFSILIMNPAGTLATLTVTLPATPVDKQRIRFSSSEIITALTLNAAGAETVKNAVTALTAGGFAEYAYRETGTTWFRVG